MALGNAAETARLVASLELQDKFTGKLSIVERSLGGFESRFSRISRGAGQVAGGIDRIATRAGLAAAGGLAAVVKTAVDFEDAFAGVRKTVEGSDSDLDQLMGQFREMARTIPISFEELSAIGEQGGALGIAIGDLEEFTRTVALLGETTDVSTEDAASALGVLSNILGLQADDFDNFGAALVDLGNKGASTESDILAIAERAGAGAKLIGVAADQTLGWASAAANLGIEAEAGGSSLQKFFLETLNNINDNDALEVMAETAGTTAQKFKRAFEEDASGALAEFIRGLGELDEASRLDVLKNLGFSDIRIQRLLLGLAGDSEDLAETLGIAAEAWEDNTALMTEAEKRFGTTRSKLDLLTGNLKDVGFIIGNEVIPIVADLSQEFVDFLNEPGTQEGIKDFAEGLAGGIRDLVSELKGTDFSGIIDGMKLAAEVAKGAFDAFRSLPQPIQQLAIAALVANKVSGGAVGQIARGLVNIGGGIFGSRGSTPANPIFTKEVGLGGAGGVGGAAGGGRLGQAGRLLAGATIVVGAAALADAIEEPLQDLTRDINREVLGGLDVFPGSVDELQWPFGPKNTPTILPEIFGGNGLLGGTGAPIGGTPTGQFNPANQGGTRDPVKLLTDSIDATRAEVKDLHNPLDALNDLGERQRADAAAADAALLGSLDTLRNRTQEELRQNRIQDAVTAQRTAQHLKNIESVERSTAANTARTESTLARKNFNPSINTSVTVNSQVSVNDVVRSTITQHVASGYRGGLIEGL